MNLNRFMDLLSQSQAATYVEQANFVDRRAEAPGIRVAIQEVKEKLLAEGARPEPGEFD